MTPNKYDNEKVIFDQNKAGIGLASPQRGFLLFYKRELEKLEGKKKLKVLDIGCGAGAKTKSLQKMFPNFEFWGYDISKKAIKDAKKDPEGIKFAVADAQDLPIKSGSVDVVIMNSVLDHSLKPKKIVREINRVLKKGGVYLVTGPLEAESTTIHGQLTRFKAFRRHRRERCGHIHALSKKSFIELVESGDFKVEKVVLGWFYFAQIVDIFYYPIVSLSGKGPEFTLNKYINTNDSLLGRLTSFVKVVFTVLENIESEFTRNIPLGFMASIRARKT